MKDNPQQDPTTSAASVSCTVCRHEIPLSEAVVAEAVDYMVYFCGLDCYQRWRESAGPSGPEGEVQSFEPPCSAISERDTPDSASALVPPAAAP